jgi:transposase
MAAPLSQDLRRRLVQVIEDVTLVRQAAARFAVSPTAVHRRRRRVTGSTQPAEIGGYRKSLLAEHAKLLQALVASRKGITLPRSRPS